MSIVSIEVKKGANESNVTLIRRFTRKVQETGMIQKVKGHRYSERALSKLKVKEGALKRMAKRKEIARLTKLGKITPKARFGARK